MGTDITKLQLGEPIRREPQIQEAELRRRAFPIRSLGTREDLHGSVFGAQCEVMRNVGVPRKLGETHLFNGTSNGAVCCDQLPIIESKIMNTKLLFLAATALCVMIFAAGQPLGASEMPWVVVSKDKLGFVLEPSGKVFKPIGFNYDHDNSGRLLEDYWETEWPTVVAHFSQMKKMGANVVRVHLQLAKFMDGPDNPNANALVHLAKLISLAEQDRIYLDLTGLGCYHKKDVPVW